MNPETGLDPTAYQIQAPELLALLPLLILTGGTVLVMLVSAFARRRQNCHRLVAWLSALTLALAIGSLPTAARQAPLAVTPLLLMDSFGLLTMGLIMGAALCCCLLGYPYWQQRTIHREEFYLLLLMGALGAVVLSCSQHFVALLLGLETLGVALFAMIAYSTRLESTDGAQRWLQSAAIDHSLEAGLKYLVLSGVASALLLFGIALLYLNSGHLDFGGFTHNLTEATEQTTGGAIIVYAGLGLLLAGIGFKLSLFPFHLWTPDVYQGAPAPVTTFVATVSKAAIFVVLLRLFAVSNGLSLSPVADVIAVIAGLSMVAGNWLALMQNNLKRLLAYSSIAHLGYILIAFLTLQTQNLALALEASVVYLSAYMATSLVAFGIVTLLATDLSHSDAAEDQIERCQLAQYRGLFWQHPLVALALTVALLSLAGIPLTFGFIGKFYLFAAGIEAGLWWLLAALVIGSGIGLFYYLRVITTLFKGVDSSSTRSPWHVTSAHITATFVLGLLTLGLIAFGVYPQPVLEPLQALATQLIEPAAQVVISNP